MTQHKIDKETQRKIRFQRADLLGILRLAIQNNDVSSFTNAIKTLNNYSIPYTRIVSEPHKESDGSVLTNEHEISDVVKGTHLTDEDFNRLVRLATHKQSKSILHWFYEEAMAPYVDRVNDSFDEYEQFDKKPHELELEFAVLNNNAKLAKAILLGNPEYQKEDKNINLLKRLALIAPIFNDLAQIELAADTEESRELKNISKQMKLHIINFIEEKTNGEQFLRALEPCITGLENHSESWTLVKNILLTLTGIGPLIKAALDEGRPYFEHSASSQARDIKKKLLAHKKELAQQESGSELDANSISVQTTKS